jgi:hypothetical protein
MYQVRPPTFWDCLPTFRDTLSVPYLGVKQSKNGTEKVSNFGHRTINPRSRTFQKGEDLVYKAPEV